MSRPAARLAWVGLGVVLLTGLLMWTGPVSETGQQPAGTATGTSGRASGDSAGGAVAGVIHELETITGALDGHELVGQRVDLHVDLGSTPAVTGNAARFWIGPADNRILVVFAPDAGADGDRREGTSAHPGIERIDAGRRYGISGRIERVPDAEQIFSWQLTESDERSLAERPIYIRADRVTPE